MKKNIILNLVFLIVLTNSIFAQTKVSGIVVDKTNKPIPFVNVAFKNSNEGILSNEEGRFYLESSKTYKVLEISSVGYTTKEVALEKAVNYNLSIQLSEVISLNEVVVFAGKTSKKDNPALEILRKIWKRKRKNGLYLFDQYQMEKYEKIEFDMNSIDSAFMKKQIFKGMEFIFKQIDTSKITGKTYLPIFINESLSEVYGDNKSKKVIDKVKASKASGFNGNQQILSFVKDLYTEYNIYDNHLTFFDKSFTSPISTTGIDVYNYILRDSAFVDDKWCYNILFYPRRKNELTFKGDFWVNDTTFAIKNINMAASKSANINWVKDIYVEQEFEVMNDSVFLLTKDYMMTDFALSKKDKSKGVYGKRTTFYKDHKFNEEKPISFYKEAVNRYDQEVYNKDDEYWKKNRFETLSKDEKGIYKMLDTLQTVNKFKQIYSLIQILDSGYLNYGNLDYGSIYSVIGKNVVEGVRLRAGIRTYFGPNDTWRLQAYTAYGFNDDKFKYGITGKWMIDKKKRVIISGGNRRDIEQIGASLTTTNDIIGRDYASSGILTFGSNDKLTNVNLSNFEIEFEPVKNLTIGGGISYRTLLSASPTFSLDYYTDLSRTIIKSQVKQSEANIMVDYTPNRKTIGYSVERANVDSPFTRMFLSYSQGFKGLLNSDFEYQKIQMYFKQPIIIGPLGRTNVILEAGKTFGNIPLGLMSVVPGNQSFFDIANTFSNLKYYEFVTDQYVTFKWDHSLQGRLFARIPFMRKLNWRENFGAKAVYGTVSSNNRMINASGLTYHSPEKIYYEYSAGIGNIFKVFRIDFSWRGNYLNVPDATKFAVKGSFGFYF
ncbi:DUF5686 and carboxypeptidase-like regulatory domain-containing protein [Flavobacterium cellulosilyticum]|uniref:Carboxypeptidase-like regulatory domain-containing protein n=1 Tax=Flavobacterium cellulosilyticum TaxID=2541731 RepID=A0A4R5CLE1_9FLAO|nr:DUF5686 and carboxypeptidase-like regulatory domain-containing protein [Flavobacterium cellulosilyticum]TDD99203.1 carboxypeptidase-like regulatory domain-containing protein [Flavobacterium cellulosilyticum]